MSISSETIQEETFCSLISKSSQADPIGSAPSYDSHLSIELNLPWRNKVNETPHFPVGVNTAIDEAAARGLNVGLTCFAPHPTFSRPGMTRVMYFTRQRDALQAYTKVEYLVPTDKVTALIQRLLADDDLTEFASYHEDTAHIRDLFVCTHGARDACCGKFGYAAHTEMSEHVAAISPDDMRVWRGSHLGGHRFAPTVLDMPEGRYWGALESEALPLLVSRSGDVSQLRPFYRGWTALENPLEQAAEGEVFQRLGWDWLNFSKTAYTVSQDEDSHQGEVEIEWTHPISGARESVRVTVEVGRTLTAPLSCGDSPGTSKEYRVTKVTPTA